MTFRAHAAILRASGSDPTSQVSSPTGEDKVFCLLLPFPRFVSAKRKREAERRKAPCPSAASVDAAAGEAHPPAFRRSTAALSSGKFVPSPRRGPGQVSWEGAPTLRGSPRQHHSHIQRRTPRAGRSAGGRDARAARERECMAHARRHRTRSASRNTFAKGVPSERDGG